jgi:RNase P subunit RPR2
MDKYSEHGKSEILEDAERLQELEKHRHFHNVVEHPRLPEDKRPVCYICHSDFPHSKNKRIRALMNMHTQFFVCETCHVKELPDTMVVHQWYNPFDNNPKGPFYGTSYDPETGSLSTGKDLISKIAPYFKDTRNKLRLAIQTQDAPAAKDYMKVRDKLSAEQREGIKNKFHINIKVKGHYCKTCHSEKSIIDFKQLGFSENRTAYLKTLEIIGLLTEYETFYLPDLFPAPASQDAEIEKEVTYKKR